MILELMFAIPIGIACALWFTNWFCWIFHYVKTGKDIDLEEEI